MDLAQSQSGMQLFTQVGLAGVLVLMILDRVFAFVKANRQQPQRVAANGAAGEKTAEYWQAASKQIMAETLQLYVLPLLKTQTEILERLEARTSGMHDEQLRQKYLLEAHALTAKESLEKLRTSNHAIQGTLQKLAGTGGGGVV